MAMIVQNALAPAAVRNAIVDLLSEQLCGLSIASAYVTVSGSGIIRQSAERYITAPGFQRIPKLIVTCFDFGLSEPDALRLWLDTPATVVRVAGAAMVAQGSLIPQQAFHPKAYAFQTNARSANLLIGSANMTGRGFSANTEAVLARRDVPLREIEASFTALSHGTTVLTAELLAAYSALRRRQPPPRELQEDVGPAPQPGRQDFADLPALLDAIADDHVAPERFTQMWVQVDSLQGGSRNQLELPRGAHRFFGFDFDGYDQVNHQLEIGRPRLSSGRRVWNDRKLVWHGNQMERIYLPTLAQGGFNYEGSAVLFRRRAGVDFELVVSPWDSDLSRSWRAASQGTGLIFRAGQVGRRLVGFL